MKNNKTNGVIDRFTIIDTADETNVIAVREKASVQIDEESGEVRMHDFIYTFDEIIAVADKLKAM